MSDVRDFQSTTYDERPFDGRAYDPSDDVRAPAWEAAATAAAAAPLVSADAPLAPEQVGGNLRRYARWQWRDFWQRRGFWMAGASLFGVWLLVYLATNEGPNNGPMLDVQANNLALGLFTAGGIAAGLLGVGGLVARERERGLQRFLFAKPVDIVRYYLQGFVVNGAGSLLVLLGAVLLAAAVASQALAVAPLLVVAAAGYLLSAGTTFLVSTLLRFDAPVAGAWIMAGFPVVALAENGYWWAQALQWLFPHGWALQLAKAVFGPAASGVSPELVTALGACIAVVYGLLCLAGGVAVLRRRSIAT